jgi:DNA-binding helix-hairpin-helix protein with protein kinase domain
MNEILNPGQTVYSESSGLDCQVEQFLGGGGQGEVYRVNLGGKKMALKWYFPHYLKIDTYLRERLQTAIETGPPSDKFLWPMELTSSPKIEGFGYIMPLREGRYHSLVDLMKRRIEPTFRALATAGFELADSFFQLHAKGLCYADISFGNVFLEPDTGHILICDNDNVDVNKVGKSPVSGTPRFMAPEIVCGQEQPSTQTDLFSLAVLLFYMFMMHHPLEGRKEAEFKCFDLPAMTKLYGTEPIFIFAPDDSNRPVPGYQDNAIIFWNIYPQFLRNLFVKAFTDGIRNASAGRVQETEWRIAMIRLRDSIIYCPHCGCENFYDADYLQASGGKLNPCWNQQCQKEILVPYRIRIGRNIVMLNYNTELFPHHVDDQKRWDFSEAMAVVIRHPTNPSIWGLKNLSNHKWVITGVDSVVEDVKPGQSVTLAAGTKINFGKTEGEIRW